MSGGWYQDPYFDEPQWRYWDGSGWTSHTAPMYQTPTTNLTTQSPPAPPTDPFIIENTGSKLFSRRIGAYLIDSILICVAAYPIWLIVMWLWSQSNDPSTVSELVSVFTKSTILSLILGAVAYFFFERIFISKNAATPGMQLLSLKVEPSAGSSLSSAANLRGVFFAIIALLPVPMVLAMDSMFLSMSDSRSFGSLAMLLGYIPVTVVGSLFILGCFAILWDPTQRAWHDRLTKAYIRANLTQDGQLVKTDTQTKKTIWFFVAVGIVLIVAMNQVTGHYIDPVMEDFVNRNFPVPL